jgi:hypothetical protein
MIQEVGPAALPVNNAGPVVLAQGSTSMSEMTNPSDTGGRLIAASKVNGTTVYNTSGEKLGSVYDVMINSSPVKRHTRS